MQFNISATTNTSCTWLPTLERDCKNIQTSTKSENFLAWNTCSVTNVGFLYSKMRPSFCVTVSWQDALRTIQLKLFHMSVHPRRTSLVPMEKNQFLFMMAAAVAIIMFVIVSLSTVTYKIYCRNSHLCCLPWCWTFLCHFSGACQGWGETHYHTFDGLYYTYQGNCTYVLMTEIIRRTNLSIYVDNTNCDPTGEVSCPRSIIISYGTEVITFVSHNLIGAAQLEVNDNLLMHSHDIYKGNLHKFASFVFLIRSTSCMCIVIHMHSYVCFFPPPSPP